jgi:hypothetical protein
VKAGKKNIGDKLNIVILGMFIALVALAICCGLNNNIEIVCLTEKNDASLDYGVRIKEIYLDGQPYDLGKIELTSGWTITEDGMLAGYTNDTDKSLVIKALSTSDVRIVYLKQYCLGKFQLKLNGQSINIDSYEDTEWNFDEVQVECKRANYGTYIFGIIVFEVFYFVWRSFGKK